MLTDFIQYWFKFVVNKYLTLGYLSHIQTCGSELWLAQVMLKIYVFAYSCLKLCKEVMNHVWNPLSLVSHATLASHICKLWTNGMLIRHEIMQRSGESCMQSYKFCPSCNLGFSNLQIMKKMESSGVRFSLVKNRF